MTDARHLIETIRNELKPVEEAIVGHRYLEALRTGHVPQQAFRIFAGQQYHIIASDLRSIALLVARHDNLVSRPYLLGLLQGENTAFETLAKFGRALGMSDTDLRSSEPIPSAFAYSAFVAWLGLYGSDAELAAAFTANFAAWGANCGQMGSALKTQYGIKSDAVAFFDLFANLAAVDGTALAVIQHGLDRGVPPILLERAACLMQGYELMFWDSMAEAAGV